MNYLQLVQKTVKKSGAKITVPSTVVAQTGITEMFVDWVAEAWRDLQNERYGIYWRASRDLDFNLVAGTHEYAIDADLESINTRSVTCHLSNENEMPVCWRPFDYYRTQIDRIVRQEGKPQYFALTTDNNWVFWPEPDAAYTVRYDGILTVQEFDSVDDGGAGSSNLLEPRNLPTNYHDAIVWKAVMSYALHFEDGSKLSEAQASFRPYKKYFEERFMPTVEVDTSALYAIRP